MNKDGSTGLGLEVAPIQTVAKGVTKMVCYPNPNPKPCETMPILLYQKVIRVSFYTLADKATVPK